MDGRRQSADRDASRQRSQSNPNVFDDEYAVSTPSSDFESNTEGRTESRTPSRLDRTQRTSSIGNPATKTQPPSLQQRSSIHKPRISYGQGDDRPTAPHQLGGAIAAPSASLPRRASSAASSYAPTSDRAQSPAPQSHPTYPYGLYQQSTSMGRTPSMATESTARPLSTTTSTTLPQRPTHPYALYTQNGLDEDVESIAEDQAPTQVGFSRTGTGFHRRIGPDGEEQDIIGPDGHTEQLPPYSRYPEEGAAKMAVGVEQPSSNGESSSPAQVTPTSTGSQAPIIQSAAAAEGRNVSEKAWSEKNWKERRKTKFIGGKVPCWMLTVMVVCAVIIVGLIAGLIGGLLSQENQSDNSGTVVTTTLYDASQIAAPSGVPIPSNGAWALPLGPPSYQQSGCLQDSAQSPAWTCSVNGPPLKLNIKMNPYNAQIPGTAQLADIEPDDDAYSYGTQPPCMDISNMEWVTDLDDPNSGPALHFQAYYDKQVLVEADALSVSQKRLRRGSAPPAGDWGRKGRVIPGDQPWLCYWNTTFIEGFIYVQENSTAAASQSSRWAPTAATPTTSATVASGSAFSAATSTPYKARKARSEGHYYPDDDYSSTSDPDTVAAQTTTPPSTTIPSSSSSEEESDPSVYTVVASGSGTSSAYTVPTQLPLFPHIVKIEERRLGAGPDAYCVRMQLLNDGALVPYEVPGGGDMMINLTEVDPTGSEFDGDGDGTGGQRKMVKRRWRKNWDHGLLERDVDFRRDEPDNSCHCQWQNS